MLHVPLWLTALLLGRPQEQQCFFLAKCNISLANSIGPSVHKQGTIKMSLYWLPKLEKKAKKQEDKKKGDKEAEMASVAVDNWNNLKLMTKLLVRLEHPYVPLCPDDSLFQKPSCSHAASRKARWLLFKTKLAFGDCWFCTEHCFGLEWQQPCKFMSTTCVMS